MQPPLHPPRAVRHAIRAVIQPKSPSIVTPDPALNGMNPNQRINTPSAIKTELCPSMGCDSPVSLKPNP